VPGILDTLIEQAAAWSGAELLAVVMAVLYLLLAIRENIWCWLCAGVSTAIYVYLFAEVRLYMESALNVFYFAMAIYGWQVWYRGAGRDGDLPVSAWRPATHAVAIVLIIAASGASGTLLSVHTDAAYPYVDSLTTWGAIWATFLVARKVLENWWYWLAIDVASVFIYWARDLQLTSLLFIIYVIMIPFGLVSWTRSYRERSA
jgi:nicotinamide mononucleotide transporter